MIQLKISETVNKIDSLTQRILLQNIVKQDKIIDRPYGEDGDSFPTRMSDGFRTIALDKYPNSINYVRIECTYNETNSGLGITEGQPALASIEVNGQAISTSYLELRDNITLTSLRVMATEPNDILTLIKVITAGQ
jgi:hypothetical protein